MPMHKFQPNEEQRRMVKALAGYGVKQRQIAALLDLASTTTLRKHFPEELRLGSLEAKAQMLGTLFKMAHSGRHPVMTMVWLKTRGGWRETGNQEAIEPHRPHQWVVHVYQPPRSLEQKGLEAGVPGVEETPEWEEFTPT
jgi:hypothetical protein